ncbi:MAG TPA: MlaA family lipoprotein, partial [Acetobacteraceae bacterium]|nr:MlaA family lipoprotein [Acetobacteraceae bacterium]
FGFGVDLASNPISYFGQGAVVETLGWTRLGLTVVDTREGLLDSINTLRQTSLDPYTTIRSAYRQRRQFEISNSGSPQGPTAPAGGFGFGQGITQAPRR